MNIFTTKPKRSKIELANLRGLVMQTKAELADAKEKINILAQTLENATSKMVDLSSNQIPIGFIYIQLPFEASPYLIWPSFIWDEVSDTYAGVFFRVTGGGAAAFGKVQEENAPRISKARYNYWTKDGERTVDLTYSGGWDTVLTSKFGAGTYENSIDLQTMGGEVRPRNMAIRVWKRTK